MPGLECGRDHGGVVDTVQSLRSPPLTAYHLATATHSQTATSALSRRGKVASNYTGNSLLLVRTVDFLFIALGQLLPLLSLSLMAHSFTDTSMGGADSTRYANARCPLCDMRVAHRSATALQFRYLMRKAMCAEV
jgi:hypothetical protein